MAQLHGFVEFRQLGEWYGAVDVGVVLVPNSALGIGLCRLSERLGMATVPEDASISFAQRFNAAAGDHGCSVVHLPYAEFSRVMVGPDKALAQLAEETMFDVLVEMARALAQRVGEGNVRLLAYLD